MTENQLILILGGIAYIILPTILGGIAGVAIIRIVQKAAPNVTDSDVVAVTRGWATGFGLGGLIAFIYNLCATEVNRSWGYIELELHATIAFAIVGTSAGLIEVKPMFKRLESLTLASEGSNITSMSSDH